MDPLAGGRIYTKTTLRSYDIVVLFLSNRLAWRCPSRLILDLYNKHVSTYHLDVGVGTGYFLDKCQYPVPTPTIALADLNHNSLEIAARRLQRYQPATYLANVLEPLSIESKFDSIGLNYVLHCLPGPMASKSAAFGHLKPLLNSGGVIFGTTILGQGVQHNILGQRLMSIYNKCGIFSNGDDSVQNLEGALKNHFDNHTVSVSGCVAFFVAYA